VFAREGRRACGVGARNCESGAGNFVWHPGLGGPCVSHARALYPNDGASPLSVAPPKLGVRTLISDGRE